MNYETAVFLINKNVRAIRAAYEPAQEHQTPKSALFKTLDPSIKVDDICVVPSTTRHKFTTVKVTEVDVDIDVDTTESVKWIVSKVDLTEHQKTLAQEEQAISTIRSAELRRKREQLADSLFKDQMATLKALPIASLNGDEKPQT